MKPPSKMRDESAIMIADDSEVMTDNFAREETGISISGKNPRLIWKRRGEATAIDDRASVALVVQTAATLSHEINSPLMAITTIVEMLLRDRRHRLTPEAREKIEQIGCSAEKIRKVTEKLIDIQALSFRETPAGRMIDLDFILKGEPDEDAISRPDGAPTE